MVCLRVIWMLMCEDLMLITHPQLLSTPKPANFSTGTPAIHSAHSAASPRCQ